jgi:hypothetical protein
MPLLPRVPGPMVIPTLFSSIPTMAKFGRIAVLKVTFYVSYVYIILNLDSGHHIVQLRLIFRAVPSRRAPYAPGTDLFLTYAQCFDIVSQPNPTAHAQRGLYPDPLMGMYILKRSQRSGMNFGSISLFSFHSFLKMLSYMDSIHFSESLILRV